MHTFGHPCRMDELNEIAYNYKLNLVEDSAESLGSLSRDSYRYNCKLGILSFNGNKIITTGGGGAILTNDPEIAKKAKHITKLQKSHTSGSIHDELGFNYRLPNINAALGCAQLENIEKF